MAHEIFLCESAALTERGDAVSFEVRYLGQACRAFAVRYDGQAHAYLNRCTHIPIEMDYQANKFWDLTGHWLICSTHGATYQPDTGQCAGGPCRGGLYKIALIERDGLVHWHTAPHLQAVEV